MIVSDSDRKSTMVSPKYCTLDVSIRHRSTSLVRPQKHKSRRRNSTSFVPHLGPCSRLVFLALASGSIPAYNTISSCKHRN